MSHTRPTERELGDYLGVLRRQWVVIALSIAVGVGVAFLLLSAMPKGYTSSSAVLVQDNTSTTDATSARTVGTVNMDTEAQVLKSLPVATAVKESVGSPLTAEQLAARVQVSVPANTTILRVVFEASTPEAAQAIAQSFATEYLAYRDEQATSQTEARIASLTEQQDSTAAKIRELNNRIPTLALGSAERATAQQTLSDLVVRARWIDEQLLPLTTTKSAPGSVIVTAQRPGTASSPNSTFVIGSSVAVLVLLGLMAAWLLDRRQGRVRTEREIETGLGLEVLGTLEDIRFGNLGEAPDSARRQRLAQEYRLVVHGVQARLADTSEGMLITGVGAASVAQDVASTLGSAVARTGSRVHLIYSRDVDLAEHGDLARAGVPVNERHRMQTSSLESEGLVVDGYVQNRDFAKRLKSVRGTSEQLVLFVTPPTGSSTDAQAIAPHVRLTVLVVELGRSRHSDVAEAISQLHQVGVDAIGALAVDRSRMRGRRGRPREGRSSARKGDPRGGGRGQQDEVAGEVAGRSIIPVIRVGPNGPSSLSAVKRST